MKKVAFLQALVLVILLSVSWILLFNKKAQHEGEPETQETEVWQVEVDDEIVTSGPAVDEPAPTQQTITHQEKAVIPPAWIEWIAYLEGKTTPREMRAALEAMRQTLFSMDREEALLRLMELIDSGVNIKTGLQFQVGPGGSLTGAGDLQTLLLDWLLQMDPVKAAALAKQTLTQSSDSLGEDAYVMHLRNYARGTGDLLTQRDRFVGRYFEQLLSNASWKTNPVPSIAEAMDFAVFLQDGSLVSSLSELMAPGGSPMLRHASSLTIERLIDKDPIGSASTILDSIGQSGLPPTNRAAYIARLDPSNPEAFALLTEYLQHPSISQQEAATFLQYFPNLNLSLSYNLVSPEISITDSGNHIDRLKSALNAIEDWQTDQVRNDVAEELTSTSQRLISQINGEPLP